MSFGIVLIVRPSVIRQRALCSVNILAVGFVVDFLDVESHVLVVHRSNERLHRFGVDGNSEVDPMTS